MNEILKSLHDRKSVRAYQPQDISPEDKRAIIEAALQAPSAGNMNLYTILDITDSKIKEELSRTCDNQPFIKTAPLCLVFCADYKRWYDAFCSAGDEVRRPDAGDLFLAQADALIAAQNAVIAAESLGIGSCYIGDIIENYEEHVRLLSLPKYVVPAAFLVFGIPTEQQKNRKKPPRFKAEDIVHENGYDLNKAGRMKEMLSSREGYEDEELKGFINRFCGRKWNSEFSKEMSRSAWEIIKNWCEE